MALPRRGFLRLALGDGRQVVRQVDDMPGFPGRPMGRGDIARKFRRNVGARWPAQRTEDALQGLWALERLGNVSALLGQLAA